MSYGTQGYGQERYAGSAPVVLSAPSALTGVWGDGTVTCTFLPQYSNTVLADSPWGLWMCNEASGATLADSSGNSRPLTISGTPTSYGFTGSGATVSGVSWPTAAATASATGAATTSTDASYTTEAWVYLQSAPAAIHTVFAVSNGTTNYAELSVQVGGFARFTIRGNGTGGSFVTGVAALTLNTWHHLVGVFDRSASPGTLHLRADKVNIGSPTTQTNTSPNNTSATAKVHTGPNVAGAAMIVGPCAYYTAALSDARIDAHYDAGLI